MEKIKKYNLPAKPQESSGHEKPADRPDRQPDATKQTSWEDWEKQAGQEEVKRNQEKELYHELRKQNKQQPLYRKKKYR